MKADGVGERSLREFSTTYLFLFFANPKIVALRTLIQLDLVIELCFLSFGVHTGRGHFYGRRNGRYARFYFCIGSTTLFLLLLFYVRTQKLY